MNSEDLVKIRNELRKLYKEKISIDKWRSSNNNIEKYIRRKMIKMKIMKYMKSIICKIKKHKWEYKMHIKLSCGCDKFIFICKRCYKEDYFFVLNNCTKGHIPGSKI